jgi:hypothetical protein
MILLPILVDTSVSIGIGSEPIGHLIVTSTAHTVAVADEVNLARL